MQGRVLQPTPTPVQKVSKGAFASFNYPSTPARRFIDTCAAAGDQKSCSKADKQQARRKFWLPQNSQLLYLSQLHPDILWTGFPHAQRRWLEHLWQLRHPGEDAEPPQVSSHSLDTMVSPSIQLDERLGRQLDIFGGCPHGDKDPDFYANVGSAIRTLREEIPALFQNDLSYEIYRPDIVFRDPKNHFEGLRNYKTIFWSLRFHGQLFFSKIYVKINRLWQPDDRTVRMRWTVIGKPRVWWEARGTFDGISNFRLDKQGKIYEHQVDNVILRDPPLQTPFLAGLNLLAGGSSRTPVPTACQSFRSSKHSLDDKEQRVPVQMTLDKQQDSQAHWTASSS